MIALVTAFASLLRCRARASVALLCVWATLLFANLASAEVGVQAKTRVWDFESASALNVCPISSASPEQHREIRSCSAGFASGSPHGARRGAQYGPSTVGAAQRVWRTLQTGGNTIKGSTAKALNQEWGVNLTRREWGRALEALKKNFNLRNDFHGKILENGNFTSKSGEVIGNLLEYLP